MNLGGSTARLAIALAVLAAAASAIAEPPGVPGSVSECRESSCFLEEGRSLLSRGEAARAVEVLKAGVAALPGDGDLQIALGAAYLAAGNAFWAIRTLSQRLAAAPGDCAARAWLAWAYLGQAGLDQAWDAAADPGCTGPDAGRLALVRAIIAGARGDRNAAADALREARSARTVWPRDRAALTAVTRQALPDGLPELSWRLEVAGGYTSNALLGSPTDPASGVALDGRSVIGQADLWLRFAPWVHAWVRPLVEVQAKGTGFLADEVRGLSWMDVSGRLGISFGKVLPRALLAWRPDWLLLAQGDRYDSGPVLYFTAHRGEVEVEVAPWLVVFAGGGRRTFREAARTRWEADLGLGGRTALARPVMLIWAATGRTYRARQAAWNLWGGSALLAVQGRLPRGFLAKAGLSVAVDDYPDSRGYDPWGAPDRARIDVLLKPGISAWSPSWSGVRVGVQYDFSWRDSTLRAYDFSDHRVTVRLAWSGDREVMGPRADGGRSVADLPWGTGGDGSGLDRVQDLLRQDEQVQRSSSCVQ